MREPSWQLTYNKLIYKSGDLLYSYAIISYKGGVNVCRIFGEGGLLTEGLILEVQLPSRVLTRSEKVWLAEEHGLEPPPYDLWLEFLNANKIKEN